MNSPCIAHINFILWEFVTNQSIDNDYRHPVCTTITNVSRTNFQVSLLGLASVLNVSMGSLIEMSSQLEPFTVELMTNLDSPAVSS